MGERLVTKISYKGQFFAASYQHWSAAAWKQLENILNELIIEHGFFENNHVIIIHIYIFGKYYIKILHSS